MSLLDRLTRLDHLRGDDLARAERLINALPGRTVSALAGRIWPDAWAYARRGQRVVARPVQGRDLAVDAEYGRTWVEALRNAAQAWGRP